MANLHTSKVLFRKVEQQHLDLPPVVGIDDPGAGVDKVLGRKTAAGSDTAVFNHQYQLISRSPSCSSYYSHVPSGTAIANPVSTNPLPLAGMTVSFAL